MAEHIKTFYNIPDEVKESVETNVGYLVRLLPGWVQELYVDWRSYAPDDKASGGTRATMTADYAYRRAYLTVYPAWLTDTDAVRREVIVHEAAHILGAPIANFVESLLRAHDEPVQKVLREQWTTANEAATQDFTRAILDTAHDYEATRGETETKPEPVTREGGVD